MKGEEIQVRKALGVRTSSIKKHYNTFMEFLFYLVRGEKLLVLRVLEVVGLEVGPQALHDLRPGNKNINIAK